MKRLIPLFILFLFVAPAAFAQTSVGGKLVDVDTKEELIGANVVLYKDGNYAAGTSTDFDGNYKISVDPGTYDVEFSYIGYPTSRVTGVVVKAGQNNNLDQELGGGDGGVTLDEVIVREYKVPLIDKDNTTSGGVITSEQIRNLPTKNIGALAATTAGLSQSDEGDDVTIRGSRSDATNYYIDGIRVRGAASMIPQTEIDQLQVITGGIEAQYGDVTGGVISITTKGPSSKFSGGAEVETSQYLDPYGYNLLVANVSGPILKKKTGESIIGFRFSGQYRTNLDDDPPATDIFQVKDEKLAELEANPILSIGGGRIVAAEFLTDEDVNVLNYQPNEERSRLDLTGKLDFRLTKAIDLSLTGSWSDSYNKFTPGEGDATGTNWRLLNSNNNPEDNTLRYRANFRFRHRLGRVTDGTEETAEETTKSIISNIQYTLIGGYEKSKFNREDIRHGDNLFAYGHIGQFDREWTNSYDLVINPDTQLVQHVDFTESFTNYDATNSSNPVLANYNNGVELNNFTDFSALNGLYQGPVTNAHGFHTNVGQPFNTFQKTDNDLYTGNVAVSFDINPGGSDKGSHGVQLGFIYEQRFDRGFFMNPRQLWQTARQLANNHITGVDSDRFIERIPIPGDVFIPPFLQGQLDSVDVFDTQYDEGIVNSTTALFWEELRKLDGSRVDQFINVDKFSPDQLSLGMFSFEDLNASQNDLNLDYYGYDYEGNLLGNDVAFNDFFTATKDVNGREFRAYPVAPFSPIYFAGYLQDKFQFKDIIFRVGVRVDRYDANTKVLRDPYALYSIQSASEFASDKAVEIPESVGDDYKVYVNGSGGSTAIGYRSGDNWFDAEGNPVNTGAQVFGGAPVFPAYAENENLSIQSRDFDPDRTFEDYEPQWNVMPRLAFSFPISDEANFFAHYDILVQRPSATGINVDRATALDYYNFENTQPAANPNLKPQKTIDYEVGFRQKVSNSSAIKIAAYYKELRDMIQRRIYTQVAAPIGNYESFGNIDFGTVKGFTFQYDLRRTGNVTASLNYTLQFADGTGSDANGRRGLANTGVIRTLYPLSYDERHRLVGTLDYRYASGSKYNGPRIGGKDILANAGLNVQLIAVSGRPYTAEARPQQFSGAGTIGQINGSRLPWNNTMNLRLDKSFRIGKADAKTPLNVNVYLRIQNVLDRRNTINVYSFTGTPDDDGFLASSQGSSVLQQAQDRGVEDAFVDAYNWRLVNPNFFSLPRRIYLGATFDF